VTAPQSANALFRATRCKPEELAAPMFGELPVHKKPESRRRDDDYYPTGQPDAIRALFA
jgi:hypothetical protein